MLIVLGDVGCGLIVMDGAGGVEVEVWIIGDGESMFSGCREFN